VSGFETSLFSPSRESGIALRESLNRDFASSFEHIFGACGEHFEVPERQVEALLSRIRAGSRETPYIYSLHFKLLEFIRDDRSDDVQALITEIPSLGPAEPGVLVTSLLAEDFPWDAGIVAGYFADEQDSLFKYVEPRADAVPARRTQIDAALDLLRQAVPGLAGELDELVTTVILARGVAANDESELMAPFEGASALRAFGAIMLDGQPDQTLVDCAASLIHEESHIALFALSPMEGVVTNADDERHESPLRTDSRPLEGVFHATFVLARMVYGMESLLSSGCLSGSESDVAADIINASRPLFFDGLKTLRRHGKFTPDGAAALEAAESYMGAFA